MNGYNMLSPASKMDNWRLSRIEEELGKLDFVSDPEDRDYDDYHDYKSSFSCPGSRSGTLPRNTIPRSASMDSDEFPPPPSPPPPPPPDEDEIYSKVVIKPAYRSDSKEDKSKEAVRVITGKYDSLGRVKPSVSGAAGGAGAGAGAVSSSGGGNAGNYVSGVGGGGGSGDGGLAHSASRVGGGGLYIPQMSSPGFTQPPSAMVQYSPAHKSPDAPHSRAPPPPPSKSVPPPLDITYNPERSAIMQQQRQQTDPQFTDISGLVGAPSLNHSFDFNMLAGSEASAPITESDIVQVELFYRSHKSDVYVCQCIANQFMGSSKACNGSPNKSPTKASADQWNFVKTGIPVVVLDTGESRRSRRLHVYLAERGTGFVLWKDSVNHLSHYNAPTPTFHTMHLSNDHTKLAGFSFDDASAAIDFHQKIKSLTADPSDEVLNLSGSARNKKKKKAERKRSFWGGKNKYRPPTKADISTPCCFTHVTNLDRRDGMSMLSTPAPVKAAPQTPTRSSYPGPVTPTRSGSLTSTMS